MSSQMPLPKYVIAARLAKYLRINGGKVLNGSCKMSLATSALCLLNNLFVEILRRDPTTDPDSRISYESIEEDVKYLYDFIRSIPSLKLFHQVQTLRGGVDLTHFSKLTVLELRKIPAHLIIGLDCLSAQLKALICSRSLYLLKEIFGTSVTDQNEPLIWSELKELNLSYNYLESLDQSLRCLPNVEILDLSHNHLKNSDEIQMLKMLTFVNLSYNELTRLPVFHISSCRSLTKLYMRNNNLEDLEGLDCLFNLEELDVSYNMLSEYHVLNPLDKLKSLRTISFEGNPLYFHNQHQLLIISYINPLVLIRGLILNGKPLSVTRSLSSSNSNEQHRTSRDSQHQTSINAVVGDAPSTMRIPSNLEHLTRSVADFSEKSSYEENSVGSLTSQSGAEQIAVGSRKIRRRKSKTGKKTKKMREVHINEHNDEDDHGAVKKAETEDIIPSHIKAKTDMEARRQQLGEAWLIPENSFSKIMLPTPQVPVNTPNCTDLVTQQNFSVGDLASKVNNIAIQCNQSSKADSPLMATSPDFEEMKEILDISLHNKSVDLEGQSSNENDDIEVLSSSCNEGDEAILPARFARSKDDFSDGDIYRQNTERSCGDYLNLEHIEELESEEESEDAIFFVEKQDGFSRQAILVNVGPNYLKEKDVSTAKLLDRIDLNSLQSVLTVKKEMGVCELHLEFDTLNSSRKRRIYIFEEQLHAGLMSNYLQPFADAKTLKEVTLGALECMKCYSKFSKQNASKTVLKTKKPLYGQTILSSSVDSDKEYVHEVDCCPHCGSHILMEMESIPLPAMGSSPRIPFLPKIKSSNKSPDSISVGSESSGKLFSNVFSSIKVSPILKRKPAVGSYDNKDSIASAYLKSDLNQSSDSETKIRRNSSDITILSNPSQSSIAVIPDPEINLNTIPEKDSQSSLSPPISQDSIYYKAHISSVPEGYVETAKTDTQNRIQHKGDIDLNNGKEPDFYSFTESSINTSASHFAVNDVTSNESDQFRSPIKSNGPQESRYDSPTMTKEIDEVAHILTILGEKRTLTYDTFTEIDHRLKLHLEINVFGNEEHLEACLMTSIVPLSSGDEFSGLFAISSKKLYVIKFQPSYERSIKNNEPIDKAVRIIHACLLGQINQIDVFLGSQGLTIACGSPLHVYSLIIRDADICNSFSSLLSDFFQEHQSICRGVEFLSSADITLQMIKDSVFSPMEMNDMPEVLLHLFAFFSNSPVQEEGSFIPVCIIITPDDLFVSRILYKKCESVSNLKNVCVFQYTSVDKQSLSDLISLKLKSDYKSVEVNFLNESSQDNSVVWNVRMETKSALFSFISALKNPWEGIFGVPLSLSVEEQ